MSVKAYPRTHYDEFRRCGYRIMYFEKVITHLTDYHYHDYYELSVILSCKNVVYICGQKEYALQDGDLVFSNVFEPHCFRELDSDAHCERFNIGIEFTKLIYFSTQGVNLLSLFQERETGYPIVHLDFRQFMKYYDLVNIYKNRRLEHGEELLKNGIVQLLLSYMYEDTCPYMKPDTRNPENVQVVTTIIEYIQNHIRENITLSQLAKETNYSVSYICATFRGVMNKTINNYIKEKRLDLAIQYLKTEPSIAEAAEKAGFNNYSYFYKVFKNIYGISPTEYRQRHSPEEE